MAYNFAAGVERRHNLRFRFGGSLTWAAKPRVRGSPDPAIDVESIFGQITPAGLVFTPRSYALSPAAVPSVYEFLSMMDWTIFPPLR